jgi:hypothetical protein
MLLIAGKLFVLVSCKLKKVFLRAYFVKNMFVVWQPIYAVAVTTSIKAIPQILRLPIRVKATEEGAFHILFFVTSLFSTLTSPL